MRKLALVLFLVLSDQWSKAALFAQYAPHQLVPLIPGLSLLCCHNTGVAWGLGSAFPQVVVLLNALLLPVFAALLYQQRSWPWAWVVGGGLGNVIDRLFYGAVRDFLFLSWGNWSWPVFNLADTYLTIGALLLLKEILFPPNPLQSRS